MTLVLSAARLPAQVTYGEIAADERGQQTSLRRDVAAEKLTLPELPLVDIATFPSETQKQVAQAYAEARKRPQDGEAVGKVGMLLDLYHRQDDAVLCYRRAHLLEPKSFEWLYYWGSLLWNQKKMEEAASVLTSALEIEPQYLAAKLKLADALLKSGKTETADKLYTRILQDDPDSAEAYYGLGRVQAERGNQAAAAENYRKACELFPTYGDAHYGLAVAYRKLGRASEAQEEANVHEHHKYVVPPVDDSLRDQLRALDMSAASHLERGVQLEEVGRIQDAIAETEKALELDPSLVKAHANLLILYARVGNTEKAKDHYEAVVVAAPGQFPDAYYNYGILLRNQGKFAEAETAFRKAVALAPSNDAAHNNLGYLLERQGKLSDAAAEYKKAIDSNPNSRQAHFNLGRVLVNQREYAEAIAQFQQTLSPVDEDTPSYLYALGAAYGRAGDRAEALRYLAQAREQAIARGQSTLASEIEKDLERVKGCEGCANSESR